MLAVGANNRGAETDGLVAAPKGDAIAWIQNTAGVRNVWLARAPGYNARPITSFTADDGVEISELAWYPDSSRVLFTRGDGANARGEFPNPHGNPAQQVDYLGEVLVLVDLSSAVSRGLNLVLTLRRNPPPPGVRVVVMTGDQPLPEAVRRSPFVVGAIRRPRHPEEAGALARALFSTAELGHRA